MASPSKWHKWKIGPRTRWVWRVRTVAGTGNAGTYRSQDSYRRRSHHSNNANVEAAFCGDRLVIVENICSLKNLIHQRLDIVAGTLVGRRAIFHHHDLAIESNRSGAFGATAGRRLLDTRLRFRPRTRCPCWCWHRCHHHLQPVRSLSIKRRSTSYAGRARYRRTRRPWCSNPLVPSPAKDCLLACAWPKRSTRYWILGPSEDGFDQELATLLAKARTRGRSRMPTHRQISLPMRLTGPAMLCCFPSRGRDLHPRSTGATPSPCHRALSRRTRDQALRISVVLGRRPRGDAVVSWPTRSPARSGAPV